MGEVYLAHDTRLRRHVAIKILPVDVTQNKTRLARFEREAYAASGLNHPNILTIHEIGEQEGTNFIASEYIEGESLRHLMTPGIELREALDIASQTAAALAAAHHAGIIHRDIKPENIMVRKDGFIKVLDFGLAKLANEAAEREETDPEARTRTNINTEPGRLMGTTSYMSPEQARGLEVDERTDLWSLGVVLYEMVSGRLPFEGATKADVLSLILHREPLSLLLQRPELPAELERIVEKALTKEKDERYQLAKDLGLDLKRLKQRLELDAELERNLTPEEQLRRRSLASASGTEHSHSPTATRAVHAAPTSGASAVHTTSSAEYVVGEIKRHKLAAGILLAVLIAAGIAALAYYRSSKSSGAEAISSVAILPFANLSGDQNMEYLSDGLSESLINSLSQVSNLKVISRGSVFKYKGKDADAAEVARALDVQAIVTGRVIQVGDQLQVSAELVDARDKTQLWGEQYKRKASDLLAVQTEISQQIATKLRLHLTNAEQQQLMKRAAANPESYDLILKARFFSAKATLEDLKRALEYCNQAIAIDPNYASAYVELADCYRRLASLSYVNPKEVTPKAEAAARKALELDDSLAEAHSALGGIRLNEWDWAGAEREFKRAIELNPNLAPAYSGYCQYLSAVGRHEEALVAIKRANALDPVRIITNANVGYRYYFARQYDQAIEHLKNTLEMDRNSAYTHVLLGYAYAGKGEFDKAIDEYKTALKIEGQNTSVLCYLGYALAKEGRRAEAEAILKQLKATKEYVSPGELAVVYAGLGNKEGALASLEKAYTEHDLQMQFLKVDPHYDSVRSEPRFQELMRKVGLPQ
jgi:eukaryotic-like serine/threonine-protein kinase